MTTKEAIEILKLQIKSWKMFKQPQRFMSTMELALEALVDKNKREEGCRCCTFERYNLTKNEIKKGYMRGKPICVFGAGRDYKEVYLMKENDYNISLVAESAYSRVETPVSFCPCCGFQFKRKE